MLLTTISEKFSQKIFTITVQRLNVQKTCTL